MTKAQNTAISYADMAAQVATHALAHDTAKAKSIAELESANVLVLKMSNDGVKVGTNGKCATATAFHSTLVQGGKSKGTASNYLSTFRQAVASGKPITEWNPAQSKSKAKAKGKGKGKAELAGLLLKAFNQADFAEAFGIIEAEYLDDKGTIHAIIKSYLEALGVEFKAE